ncbi:dermonecrotic toxin domain-containing protein [Pseudomonas sp. HT11]|uniref:dermonecrotic toxin domain-containing protein n=1 Tax=Pseudomonas sp. HT11 TaxID=3230490 RepID=UPI00384D2C8F
MPTDSSALPFQGRHFELIQNALPDWVKGTTAARIGALKRQGLASAAPYLETSPAQHVSLKRAVADHWHAQAALDKRLGPLNDLRAFAEPLLKRALFTHYGEVDVRNTWLRVYVDASNAWWVINVKRGVQSKTLSLLDMALHNFAAGDTFVDHAFLGPEDARGQRDSLTIRGRPGGPILTAQRFKAVCRSLDIGGLYQARLQSALGFDQPALARTVRDEVVSQLKADLRSSAHLGLHSGHLANDAHHALLKFIDTPLGLSLDGHTLRCHTLSLAECELSGIMLFATPAAQGSALGRLIAWVPQDPEHPLKQYPSPIAFVEELTRQLHSGPAYQAFFSQFVAHAERGVFFSRLQSRAHLPLRLVDIDRDHPNRAANPARDDPWNYLHRVKLNKIVNDARELAVSTAYVDRLARWAWWDNLEQILSDVLNAALLVVTPFVPVVGQLMLAYSAYQLCDDVFEGLLDWAQGNVQEAGEHVLGVAENLIQLALFAGAGKIGEVARLKLSAFVEGLHPVQQADGTLKLWNPDLAPYAQPSPQGPTDKTLLPLEDRHYHVRHDAQADEHRVVHPTREQAYQPWVRFNADGAFLHEGEQPQRWDSQTLMRRIGPRVKDFSDQQLADLRIASGTDEGVLRAMHLYNEPLPPLLAASLGRLEAQRYPEAISRKVRAGTPLPNGPSSDWFPQLITELPGWPQDNALKVCLNDDLSGPALTFGNVNATQASTLTLSLSQTLSGTLPERVLAFLDDAAIRNLLNGDVPKDLRLTALRDQLADRVLSYAPEIADKVYKTREITDKPSLATLRKPFEYLDSNAALALLGSATGEERQALAQRQLPLRLHNQARELGFANQSVLAFQGFDWPSPLPTPTERLVLNTLKFHSDTFARLRIEIREQAVTGRVLCEAGPATADTTRVLIRKARGYEVLDPLTSRPSALIDLYEAILQALPADRRDALGMQTGEGQALKHWLKQRMTSLAERRKVLAQPPVPMVQGRETSRLLGGPAASRCSALPAQTHTEHARQTLQLLFPHLSEARLNRFLEDIPQAQLRHTLNTLVVEKQQLHVDLMNWQNSLILGVADAADDYEARVSRKHLAHRIMRCWGDRFAEFTDGRGAVQQGATLNFKGLRLPPRLPTLSASFEHVTFLDASQCGFGERHSDFLKHFPSLRGLNLADNRLTQVPKALEQMRFLKALKLAGNRLALTAEDVTRLKKLRRLKSLDLSNNPLTLAPDISHMPGLHLLYLRGTRLATWPQGLFAHPRNDAFVLDLRGTRINRLPEVAAGSAQGRVVARARLDRRTLPDEQRLRYEALRVAAGLDPNRTYEPLGHNAFWTQGLQGADLQDAQALWQAVEQEQGSQGFFEVIEALEIEGVFETDADRQRYAVNRPLLTQQVWRLLWAAHEDTELRERLFKMASFPGLCPDAGAQIFNEMGIEVMVSEIRRDTATAAELESRLVTLAKGSAHLKQLAKAVGQEIARRLRPVAEGGLGQRFRSQVRDGVPGEVDEVDIHLAYQTALARRLDLPWLSDHMLYRVNAAVSAAQIEQAYSVVLELDEGDGLVNQMLLEPWWEQHLRDAYDSQYRDNEREFGERFLALDDLQTAQAQWANAQALPEPERERLRAALKHLAEAVQVPESVVFTAKPMDDAQYNRLLNDLGYNEQEWMRRLTRRALSDATGRSNRSR